MLACKSALRRGSGQLCSATVTKALAQLTLSDLKSYIPETAAVRYMEDPRFPVAEHTFSLEEALRATGPNRLWGKAGDLVGFGTLYETDNVVLRWFVLPPGGVLPLHDHCTMRVWQRLLFGSLHVTSFDWAEGFAPVSTEMSYRRGGEAVVVFSGTVEASSASSDLASLVTSFGPHSGGVLHEIENKSSEPTLFINVMTPPYNKPPLNINCMFYTLSGLNGPHVASSGSENGAMCREKLTAGQRVLLTPRLTFEGEPMEEFMPLHPLL